MDRTEYRDGKAQECLGTIASYDLEGSFDDAIKALQKEKDSYIASFVSKPFSRHSYYCDGYLKRTVQYQRLWLQAGEYYDGEKTLQVWGEREMAPEEKAFLEKQAENDKKNAEKREQAEFERLKQKFGDKK